MVSRSTGSIEITVPANGYYGCDINISEDNYNPISFSGWVADDTRILCNRLRFIAHTESPGDYYINSVWVNKSEETVTTFIEIGYVLINTK